ncbi:MAG: hypothetical protein M1829_001967 [Trizodia sp. TS-e1964]|nr:MAG: hypothetical protein M1829_001967 [Trizodia sp. TS-e1964]
MMLALRDQENLAYERQIAASTKPLNQGVRQFAPKTPGNKHPKTPFKIPLNDENSLDANAGMIGFKTALRLNDDLGLEAKNVVDKNAFITPLGSRTRAPLGLKTTNAKAKGLQTPALGIGLDKSQVKNATIRKTKQRVLHVDEAQTKTSVADDSVVEREIEYMPPRPKALPDFPEDMPPPLDYSQLEGQNLVRGMWVDYLDPIDDNGVRRSEKGWQKELETAEREMDAMILESMENTDDNYVFEVLKTYSKKQTSSAKRVDSKVRPTKAINEPQGPATEISIKAASLLSSKPKLLFADKPRKTSFIPSRGANKRSKSPTTMQHTAARVVSNSTLGYTRGRSASSNLKKRQFGDRIQDPTSDISTSIHKTSSVGN